MLRLLGAILVWLLAFQASAQDQATLVADRVYLSGDDTLTAEGAVEVFYKGSRLTAEKIVYDQQTDVLTIKGPIRLTEEDGTILMADAAELSRDLQEGILSSARLVLDQQLQRSRTTGKIVPDRRRQYEQNRLV